MYGAGSVGDLPPVAALKARLHSPVCLRKLLDMNASEQAKATGFRGPNPSVGKATQFRPGQSGNPGGRPKMKPITDAYRAILASENPEEFEPKTGAERIAFEVYQQAQEGRLRHAKEITDRVEGRVTQPIAGADGGEIRVIVYDLGSGGQGST
jgi:hypothetical protein